jgi:hypothetical protein
MISKDEAIAKFQEIIGAKEDWKLMIKSQFVKMLAVFQSWALREALWKVERTVQEFFLSTALNRASILAHVEDREYIPRKPEPATGTVAVTNNGSAAFSLPLHQPFLSDTSLYYVTAAAIEVAPGASVNVAVKQLVKEEVSHTVTAPKAFYEILFDRALTYKIHEIEVWVDINDGNGSSRWEYSRLFQNTAADSRTYDEFFSHNDQIGVRFGNGNFGKMLPVGAMVQAILWLTEGDTTLLPSQPLHLVGEVLDYNQNPVNLTAATVTSINEGRAAEDIEETKRNLHYWPTYDERLVWQNDYEYFLRRAFPGIIWLKIWGETEETALRGFRYSNINKIFVSAYDPNDGDIGTKCMEQLSLVPLMNQTFKWMAPLESTFTVKITGVVARTAVISTVIQDIKSAFIKNYGKDSTERLPEVLMKDFYRLINDSGHFAAKGAYFNVTFAGTIAPSTLNEMNYIDLNNSMIEFDYL